MNADHPRRRITPALLSRVRRGRLRRLRSQMERTGIDAVVLVDPVNVRYATGTRNMQVFCARNPARYVFVPVQGPVVLFEFAGCAHLAAGVETVDEIRIATTASYVAAGDRLEEKTWAWAAEIDDLLRRHCGTRCRVGLERFNAAAAMALAARGHEVADAQEAVERARAIKVAGELTLMQAALDATMTGVARLRDALEPGITENRLWAVLWQHVIENGGDYVETRLLNSGPRTNPWFQESSERVIGSGDMVCLDTDVVGCHGYYADFSRSFVCGSRRPTPAQRRLYGLAFEQVHHNLDLIRPGIAFAELSAKGWRIPPAYRRHRYYLLAHGIGMTGEYPYILYGDDYADGGYDGTVEPGMVLCVESFIGSSRGGEGVKLEQQIHVTDSGWELMSTFPFEESLLGREV
jgi:Xaa-Pro aminopeptidase